MEEILYNFSIIDKDCEFLYQKLNTKINRFKDKTIFITGANGLLGSFLTDFFCYVNETYNFNIKLILTSLSDRNNLIRIKRHVNKNYVQYVSHDMSQPFSCENKFAADFYFFMSGYGQPKKFINNQLSTMFINTVGLNSILTLCKQSNGKLIYASSSEIYGDPDRKNIPTSEDYNGNYSVFSNRACYITAKRMGEVMCNQYNKEELFAYCARIALTYGPGVLKNDDRVMQEFIFKAKTKNIIKLLDDGSSIRNYLYITDCVEKLINILLNGKKQTYNIGGTTEQVTIHELAKIIGYQLNVPIEKGPVKAQNKKIKTAPKRVGLCMKKYNDEFGKNNDPITLQTGVNNVIQWYNMSGVNNDN